MEELCCKKCGKSSPNIFNSVIRENGLFIPYPVCQECLNLIITEPKENLLLEKE